MIKETQNLEEVIYNLNERAKELSCLYKVEEILKDFTSPLEDVFNTLLTVIPTGWQFVELCKAKITYNGKSFSIQDFPETEWQQSAKIIVDKKLVGNIQVFYTSAVSSVGKKTFLSEEEKLLGTIADRLSNYIFHKNLQRTLGAWETAHSDKDDSGKKEWQIIIDLLKKTNVNLFLRISRKLLNHLAWIGIGEARNLLQMFGVQKNISDLESIYDTNKPSLKKDYESILQLSDSVFTIAEQNITNDELFALIQKWIKEERLTFLIRTLENVDTSLGDIFDALTRYHHLVHEKIELSPFLKNNIIVQLIHRLFTEQLEFINIAKQYVEIDDFFEILQHTVFPENSHGKLGGKSAGLFLAQKILQRLSQKEPLLKDIKVPRTWYISSDAIQHFLYYNNLEEIIEQKYKDIEQIRQEYPNIVQIFKNSRFPSDIIKGLSLILDDFENKPIIVRSSSLLEDRFGFAFAGKYKSLFLANRGSKGERLNALMDAIAEVYASVFGPDPILYRKEKGLIDFHEEMAVMVQEVVGTNVANYFLPSFAGVAFSNNEFRWSPRIKREDGLLRIVAGLGTRAVDRLSDDYPVLLSPGQPNIRVNVSPEEMVKYSPRKIDVINLEKNTFETIQTEKLFKMFGNEYPSAEHIVSVYSDEHVTTKSRFHLDFENDELVITFSGLFANTPFVKQTKLIMDSLKENMGIPVDVEFASTGKDFYLLQCRPQSFSKDSLPSPIPKDIPHKEILFSAKKFISNGKVPDITHIVYVDPNEYQLLDTLADLKSIGRVIGKLNVLLPKRQFILMGPGRWGSRGDIKLGVNVTYSDISNTAMLIEIAKSEGNYVPELSFGTHFFQDLVESSIRYLPLYPDEQNVIYNEAKLKSSKNLLSHLFPEFSLHQNVVKVIDVKKECEGKILKVLMNAELEEAVAFFDFPSLSGREEKNTSVEVSVISENHWRWRLAMAENIAKHLNFDMYGVKGLYIYGSAKNATAGPASDIDLLVHFTGTEAQKEQLLIWLHAWSVCLSEINYVRTGYHTEGILDIHFVSDEDIENRTSFAIKIGAITDAARPLKVGLEKITP
ncbi:MAG: pyruvate, phosphate dikinase [Ignavibacteria bacterium]|nr:pyruvate, phosphate dikinase [Ignavibacteria bacterium]